MIEAQEIVTGAFDRSILERRYVHPQNAAEQIVFQADIDCPQTRIQIEHSIRYLSTAEFRYPDVFDFFQEVLGEPNTRVDIWTDDYLDRVASSGVGPFRRELTQNQRRRFGVVSDRVDKLRVLSTVFTSRSEGEQFVIVDDSVSNLHVAEKIAGDLNVLDQCRFIFMDRHNNVPPNGFEKFYSFSEIPHVTIESNTNWLVDFNGVVIDDVGYRTAQEQLAVQVVQNKLARLGGDHAFI